MRAAALIVIVVPLISVTLVLAAKSLPLEVVTISPTFIALLLAVNVVEALNVTVCSSVAKYLNPSYDPVKVIADPAAPL